MNNGRDCFAFLTSCREWSRNDNPIGRAYRETVILTLSAVKGKNLGVGVD